jgi:hypothetical protein
VKNTRTFLYTGLFKKALSITIISYYLSTINVMSSGIPLQEHPRPDFQRSQWMNLNGTWEFNFDLQNEGIGREWFSENHHFPDHINVPFSWGSKLSGIDDRGDIGWYKKSITFPGEWKGKRIFLVVGASDWLTKVWLNGNFLGEFQGGYTPFEFELTKFLTPGKEQNLVIRVDDTSHPFKLEGKQGYGKARGIWQTVYLEPRGNNFFDFIHFTPDIDHSKIIVSGSVHEISDKQEMLRLIINKGKENEKIIEQKLNIGTRDFQFEVPLQNIHLWSIDDPYLYDANIELADNGSTLDNVDSYFGMRKISTMKLPGTDYMYVALNNNPVYLKMTLDQAYHPDGFYTWPSDEFMRDEIMRSKKIGLNCNRIHVKIEVPRKLYWADRLGLLIMADVPNSWGEPDADMRKESETAMVNMLKRDYNHPCIFSWVLFNETWGLFTKTDSGRKYLPETAKWVIEMYQKAKLLDPSRLVEDNSACNYDHVKTDINSWHAYLPGYEWKKMMDQFTLQTFPGSGFNYVKGYIQGNEPMINSECGNVWGYEGSTGDVDWSWDYHIMMNQFRLHPKIAGWLYTEHHDVINEWNGYYRFDRTGKFTGLEELVPGMSLADLHSDIYLVPDYDLCTDQRPGTSIEIPVWMSVMKGKLTTESVIVKATLQGWNRMGIEYNLDLGSQAYPIRPWMTEKSGTWKISLPDHEGLAVIAFRVEDPTGNILQHNFISINITNGSDKDQSDESSGSDRFKVLSVKPSSFSLQQWSVKQWNALGGKKINGAGTGYFEYKIKIPTGLKAEDIKDAAFRAELSAKPLLGKDYDKESAMGGDYMRGQGTYDPGRNPNSYPMTDVSQFGSNIKILINGEVIGTQYLPDDPADHRGILSWHNQKKDHRLSEAGTYGYLVSFGIPADIIKNAFAAGSFIIRMEAGDIPGGLAVYGKESGRYPLDPSVIFRLR